MRLTAARTTYTAIPSSPGYSVVEPVAGEGGGYVALSYTPVVAWVIKVDVDDDGHCVSEAMPVTPDYMTPAEDAVLRIPSGEFLFPGECIYDNPAAALTHFIKRFARQRAK